MGAKALQLRLSIDGRHLVLNFALGRKATQGDAFWQFSTPGVSSTHKLYTHPTVAPALAGRATSASKASSRLKPVLQNRAPLQRVEFCPAGTSKSGPCRVLCLQQYSCAGSVTSMRQSASLLKAVRN